VGTFRVESRGTIDAFLLTKVWNEYSAKLGIDPQWSFTDIYGLDPDLLAMVPQPTKAVLMLFPITERVYSHQVDLTIV